MLNKNKPLLLRPSGKDYLWDESRLNDEFEKGIDLSPLVETRECSTHPDGPSYVVNKEYAGQELAEVLKQHLEYLGERHKGENSLPILIKFIDAKKDLSVQVHPTDEYAREKDSLTKRKCGMCWKRCETDLWAQARLHERRNLRCCPQRNRDEVPAKSANPQE